MGTLLLVRHGESEWNSLHLWTGLTNISLSSQGEAEARLAGAKIRSIIINRAYTSVLRRAIETLDEIKTQLMQPSFPITHAKELDERDYGIYTGKNKWDIEKTVGKEMFLKIRRGWDVPIKNGESLENVYARVVPYFEKHILPKLIEGETILISAHGNSLRALVKFLDDLSETGVESLEIPTGQIIKYEIDAEGFVHDKKIL